MNRPWIAAVAFALGLLTLSPNLARGQQTLYGATWAGQLITIDTMTGAGTLVGTFAGPNFHPTGIGFQGPQLFALSEMNWKLSQINPATGVALPPVGGINLGLPTQPFEGDMAFRNDGVGFIAMANGTNQLWTFNVNPPTSSLVGPLIPMDGLSFNPASVLYGIDEGCNKLYTINQATGATTLVGNTGVGNANSTAGIAFDSAGNLFAAIGPWPIGATNLYTINPATGAGTLIGNVGFNGVAGIAFGLPAGVTVAPTTVNVVEGGATATYTVVLNGAPSANVTITATPDAQETVAPAVLTFTPANWNLPQTVTVTAVNHGVYVPPHTGLITHAAASTDVNYSGMAIASVNVNITSSLSGSPGGSGGVGEGSYAGCADPPSPGGEASFGFGAGITGESLPGGTVLSGPYLDGPGTGQVQAPAAFAAAPSPGSRLRVFNVAGQGKAQADGGQAGSAAAGALGWAVLAALALVGAAALVQKLRATAD